MYPRKWHSHFDMFGLLPHTERRRRSLIRLVADPRCRRPWPSPRFTLTGRHAWDYFDDISSTQRRLPTAELAPDDHPHRRRRQTQSDLRERPRVRALRPTGTSSRVEVGISLLPMTLSHRRRLLALSGEAARRSRSRASADRRFWPEGHRHNLGHRPCEDLIG